MNNKAKMWLAGGLAVALVVLAAGYFLVVKPKKDDVAAKKTEVASVQADNTRLQTQINQLLCQSKQITQKQVELAKVATRIPSDPGLPNLLRRLAKDATDSDVDLVSFVPSTPAAATSYEQAAAPYSQITMTMEVHGTYPAMHEWFTHLEDSTQRLIVVEHVDLSEPKAGDTTGKALIGPDGIPESNRTLTASITARTFNTTPSVVTADLPAIDSKTKPTTPCPGA